MPWPENYAAALADEPMQTAQDKFGRIADAFAAGLRDMIETPGRAMREGITTDQAVDWAAPTALGMVAGARLPGGAPEGALGSSGAKLVQPEGIRAYHGSPYDFDRFDASKIGTGEGAQAYGHGLYFAEAEPTALSYKNMMKTTDMDWPVAGTDLKLPAWVARSSRTPQGLDEVRNNFLGRIEESKARLDGGDWNAQTQIYHQQKIIDALDAVKAGAEVKQPGHMYEVNIGAKPEQFLDWDKPLSQQGEPARKALNDIWGLPSKEAQTTMTGDDAYRAMGITFHQPGRGHLDNSTVSGALREAGIPGIRYLDQGSRGAQVPAFDQHLYKPWGGKLDVPEPTRNYVVFDPGIVDILRKYGLAGLTAGGAANYAAGLRGEQ